MATLKELRNTARNLSPCVRIGKLGVSEGLLKEICTLLDKRKLIKIKILQGALEEGEKEKIVNVIVEKSGATLIQSVGLVFVLHREKASK